MSDSTVRQVTLGDVYVEVPIISELGEWKEELREEVAWRVERWNMLDATGTGIVETGPFIAVTRRRHLEGMAPGDPDQDIFRLATDQHAAKVFGGAASPYDRLTICGRQVWTRRWDGWISLAVSVPEATGENAAFAIDTMSGEPTAPEHLAELFGMALSSLTGPDASPVFACDVLSEMPPANYWVTETTEPNHD